MNTRSTGSSSSFSTGSSVTTHVCSTVAETRPFTCRPLRPCRVRSKLATRRGNPNQPGERGNSRACCGISDELEVSPGFRHLARRDRHAPGALAPGRLVDAGHCRRPRRQARTSISSGSGRRLRRLEALLLRQPAHHLPGIVRQPVRTGGDRASGKIHCGGASAQACAHRRPRAPRDRAAWRP